MREVIGIDFYNHLICGSVSKTLTGQRIDPHNIQCVLLANSSGEGIAGTLDSSYYKGQGERQGIEREYVVIRNDSRPSDTED